MEPLGINWLVTASCSPLVAVLALWTIYVFHTYRRRWRTVDILLLTAVSQELLVAVFVLCFAVVALVRPAAAGAPCRAARWGLVATRTFQAATLASLAADRSLTLRWPYRYRFSVRRNAIRYHVGALALVSALVGAAAAFATAPEGAPGAAACGLHPSLWDPKFSWFLLSLHGALALASLACLVQVEACRSRHAGGKPPDAGFRPPASDCASPECANASGAGNSPLDTQSSAGSTRALHRPSRQASRRPYGRGSGSDLRWPSVAFTCLLCFSVNHIPNLVLTGLAAWSPPLWSPWHEAILCWLGLLEGVLLPLLLFLRDGPMRTALRRTFQRRSGALSPLVGDDGPFQMYFDKDHFRKRGTFGSVTPVGIITNYRRAPGTKKRRHRQGAKYSLPGLHAGDSVLAKSCFLGSGEPLSKLSCADLTSLEMWREEEEENFYASLSDDFSTFSCKSGEDSALSEDLREELYSGGSFTTIANDDFEFHDTRPCGGEVRMRPSLVPTPPPPHKIFSVGLSRNVSFRESFLKKEGLLSSNPEKESSGLFDLVTSPDDDDDDDDRKDRSAFILPAREWRYTKIENECTSPSDLSSSNTTANSTPSKSPPQHPPRHPQTTASKKATSFSMNDLDLISKNKPAPLPVKSESTMSLYRLNEDMDRMVLAMAATPLAKSETDVGQCSGSSNTGADSGFGSGAQSTNPVWSGFLCRKPDDPFWNIRKPTAAVASPTGNGDFPAAALHPRMRKIPWITAWKKLGSGEKQAADGGPKAQSTGDKIVWTDPAAYGVTSPPQVQTQQQQATAKDNPAVTPIEEEMSDVGTPVFHEEYNLDVFKKSGVLLENAYGKIERDDCGVRVNFYGENVQFDAKGTTVLGSRERVNDNPFDNSFDSGRPVVNRPELNLERQPASRPAFDSRRLSLDFQQPNFEHHVYEPLNVKRSSTVVHLDDNLSYARNGGDGCQCEPKPNGDRQVYDSERRPTGDRQVYDSERTPNGDRQVYDSERTPNGDAYACEPRLNGGHYENMFGTKENIFANCDQYVSRVDLENERFNLDNGARGHQDKYPSYAPLNVKIGSNYGQLNRIERTESFSGRNNDSAESRNGDIVRRVSDSRDRGCGIRRKESKTKNDRRPDGYGIRAKSEYGDLQGHFDSRLVSPQHDKNRNRVEFEMTSVPGRNDLNSNVRPERNSHYRVNVARKDSRRTRPDVSSSKGDYRPPEYIEIRDDRGIKIIRRESFPKDNNYRNRRLCAADCDNVYEEPRGILWQNRDGGPAGAARHRRVERSWSIGSRYDSPRKHQPSGRRSSADRADSFRHISAVQDSPANRCRRSASAEAKKCPLGPGTVSPFDRERSQDGCVQTSNSNQGRNDATDVRQNDSPKRRLPEIKNEGLWVNAIPLEASTSNGDKPKRDRREVVKKDSPRKSQIPRRESRGRNPQEHPVKRKVSDGSRATPKHRRAADVKSPTKGQRRATVDDFQRFRDICEDNLADDLKTPTKGQRRATADDFQRFRNKCEDNLSHIQNINRETSAEREHLRLYGKLNGNGGAPQTTSEELGRSNHPATDVNDNPGKRKLAITDFL